MQIRQNEISSRSGMLASPSPPEEPKASGPVRKGRYAKERNRPNPEPRRWKECISPGLFDKLAERKPPKAPDGDQMDFVEAMEIDDSGLIKRHCVYWGWYGVGVLQRNEYHR